MASFSVVSGNQTTTLAWFAEMAYEDSWTSDQVLGWHLVSGNELGISDNQLSSGHYVNANGSALVASADFNGSNVLMISFRGSDDNADWVTNITDIDEHFELFSSLTTAAETALHNGTYDAIMVTGHSLGGAMTEAYLHTYSDPNVFGISWGSPGIHMDNTVTDSRLINYVFNDDGVAWLGTERNEIASEIHLWSLGNAANVLDSLGVAASFSLVAALTDLSGDYQHQGTTAIVNTSGDYTGSYDSGISLKNFSSYVATHDMGRYLTTSLSLNPNPFDIPGSTVTGTMLSDTEAMVLKLYDMTYDSLPSFDHFASYVSALEGSSAVDVAASMLNGSGLHSDSRVQFLDTMYMNMLGRPPTNDERKTVQALYATSAPANVLVYLAGTSTEQAEMASTVNLVGAMDWYG